MGGAGRWQAAGVAALLLGGAWTAPVEAQRGASRPPPPVVPKLDLGAVGAGPFPSDRWTVPDALQRTGLRVALPMPDCRTQASDCDEIRLLNDLDGFDLRPRMVKVGEADHLLLQLDTVPVVGVLETPKPEIRPHWLPFLRVSDIAAVIARTTELGGRVILAPRPDLRNGSVAIIADPTGAAVGVQQL